jgi:hypothetical protein
MSTMHSADGEPQRAQHDLVSDLAARVSALENDVRTLAAAVDAASRLRISTPVRLSPDIRIAGGKNLRRILERGGLVYGYPEAPGTE